MQKLLFLTLLFFFGQACSHSVQKKHQVIWDSPSKNSLGAMPAGNGDIGISLWVEENGDLLFYLSKTDAWSDNGRLLKLGKVRVALEPNPFLSGSKFRQELLLEEGMINIQAGEGKKAINLNIWVDANHLVVEFDFKSKSAIEATVTFEPWRTERRALQGEDERHSAYGLNGINYPDIYVEKDSLIKSENDKIVWLHRNEWSIWEDNLQLQALGDWAKSQKDPLLHRTFGGLISSNSMVETGLHTLQTPKPVKSFTLSVHAITKQTESVDEWVNALETQVAKVEEQSRKKRLSEHKNWWNSFWDRSYIHVLTNDKDEASKVELVNQGYLLQRYMHACSGRGNSPIKFNGSIFTLDTEHLPGRYNGYDADYRRWGGPYWWQNTRLPYWSMLIAGDFDLMKPLFKMYMDALPIRMHATNKYFHHGGAHYPETMYFWGTIVDENYGRDREGKQDGITDNGYIRRYWQSGLEMSLMMLDYYDMTQDKLFARETAIPFTTEILTFYDAHWDRDENGKIRFDPAQSLETWWESVNPLPEIVGIWRVANNLLRLPDNMISVEDRKRWEKLINDLPPIPMEGEKGGEKLVPGETYGMKKNTENTELYAIFPYRVYGIGKPGLEIARRTFNDRIHKETGGWQQNAIQSAYLGLAHEASEYVAQNFSTWNENYRFPVMYGPNYDWIPDQTHGSVAMSALQRMLMQTNGDTIYLLPAWPENWNAIFKLHAPQNTTIEGKVMNGKIEQLKVNPRVRRKELKY